MQVLALKALHSGKFLNLVKTGQFSQGYPDFKTKISASWKTSQTYINQGG